MDELELTSTDSPEVMEQVISAWLTNIIWDQQSRGVHPDHIEDSLVELYCRVHGKIRETLKK